MAYKRSATGPIRTAAVAVVAATMLTVGAVSPAGADSTYVVQPGDTLSVIAKRHGVSTRDLAAANAISNYHLIRVGQRLTVPAGASGGSGGTATEYRVASGDTISGIAKRFGVSRADLIALNKLSDPNRIKVGQRLLVPGGGQPSAPSVTDRYPDLPSRLVGRPERLALVPSFERWAAHYGVPADLLMAICYQESGWQSTVISHKGAIGIGQLMPVTAAWLANDMIGIPSLDPYNPDDNIRMSARFLRWLIGYHGSEPLALAGYYQGPTSVKANGLYPQTQAYVAAVEGGRWRFRSS